MSLQSRLSSIEEALNADEPVLITVVYAHDEPNQEPQPLSPEQIERARELFKQAVESDPGKPFYTVYLNDPA